jgi:hypothetical protein
LAFSRLVDMAFTSLDKFSYEMVFWRSCSSRVDVSNCLFFRSYEREVSWDSRWEHLDWLERRSWRSWVRVDWRVLNVYSCWEEVWFCRSFCRVNWEFR